MASRRPWPRVRSVAASLLAGVAVCAGVAGVAVPWTAPAHARAASGGSGQVDSPAIHERVSPPAIDGDLRDWRAVPAFPIPGRHGDAMAHARLAYDDRALYLALEVVDDSLTFPHRSWRFGDGFYLTVLMPGGGERSRSYTSLGVSRSGDRLGATVVNRSGEYFPALSARDVRVAMDPAPEAHPALSEGVHPWSGPVVYEVAVPWSLLDPADPLTVDSLAVNIVLVDRDGGSDRRFGLLHPDPGFDTERTPLRAGRLLPLVRGAPGTDRLAVRGAAPIVATGSTLPATIALRSETTASRAAPRSPTSARVELVRGDAVLRAWDVELQGGRIRRASVPLRIPSDVGTGPAALQVRSRGLESTRRLFLVDTAELERERATLPDRAAPGAEPALPTALIRLEWLERAAASPASNAPLQAPGRWWEAYRQLATEIERGFPPSLLEPGIHQLAHRSGIDGTLQPYSVSVPTGSASERRPYPLLVALHGSGVDEEGTIRSAGPPANEQGYLVVAPRGRGLSDWYIGDAGTDVVEVIEHVRGLYPVDTSRIALTGFSMGGHGAWRLALRHPDLFWRVAVLAGADCPPASTGGECVHALLDRPTGPPSGTRPPLLVLHGGLDRAVPVADARRLVAVLERTGWPHEYREFPETAHGDAAWLERVLDWLGTEPH